MESVFRSIIIICEGKSEYCYIQNLNLLLREYGIVLIPKISNGWNGIIKLYKKIRKDNKKGHIEIWCDEDVFKRSGKKTKELSNALTNIFNFEDFLVLHLDKQEIIKWQRICEEVKHFSQPMKSDKCEECIQGIFSGYKKGSLPTQIVLNVDAIKRLFQNNNDIEIPFSRGFASFLENVLNF